ncbi:MAG: branched-chain amino acid ABC transporter permease [Sagittula sp.]|uniref:branched-chain amino acid ABC transporter permease n=1 Tax=Sagittula sp. TaxID=2038081 RepID=UPI004058F017
MNSTQKTVSRLSLAAAAIVAVTLPWMLTNFETFQMTQVQVYAIAILGLNLLIGYNGQISLGHGAFYAIGAFSVAILSKHFGVPYWAGIPLGGLIAFAIGFLFGFPALRLEGHYLALATFALALAVPQLLKHPVLSPWTGGVQGIFIPKPKAPFGLPLSPDQWLYYFTLVWLVIAIVLAHNLLHGRIGNAMRAIRDNATAASAMGMNTARIKSLTFGVSALYTGIAGGLSAAIIQFVAPDSFTMFLSVFLFVGVVVGGIASIWGALIGGAFIVFVPNIAADISKAATNGIYGLFLIALMYFMPNGVWGGVRSLFDRLGTTRRSRPGAAETTVEGVGGAG